MRFGSAGRNGNRVRREAGQEAVQTASGRRGASSGGKGLHGKGIMTVPSSLASCRGVNERWNLVSKHRNDADALRTFALSNYRGGKDAAYRAVELLGELGRFDVLKEIYAMLRGCAAGRKAKEILEKSGELRR